MGRARESLYILLPSLALAAGACGDAGEDTDGVSATGSTSGLGLTGGGVSLTSGASGSGGSTSADDSTGGASSTDTEDTSAGPKFDLAIPDVPGESCGGMGGGDVEFSYIWIANSEQGTLSKVNTETLVEEGRYRVRPDSNGLPSRTSVNLAGDVAVANRSGGITKVYALHDKCGESNGIPGLQTSTGANDILPWGEEECVAWHTPMNYQSQRPIAWTQGSYNDETCAWTDQKVWTTGTNAGGSADVFLLNGDTGAVEGQTTVPNLALINTYGGYGAVVDAEGNLWFNEMFVFGDKLIRVDLDNLSYELISAPGRTGYGIAIDASGRLFTCGGGLIARYDPVTLQWQQTATSLQYGGCMVDAIGRLWVSGSNNGPYTIQSYDVNTLQLLNSHPMTEHVHGISIDFAGYVWGVGGEPGLGLGARAFRVDPDTGVYDTVEGLTGAYTYSDMTGFALASQTPQG
ncbi:MAG: hypothetical protein H6713_01360 [Myxococcales bacterium]|nr:hypothetical protein [Myxococcales bacterium]